MQSFKFTILLLLSLLKLTVSAQGTWTWKWGNAGSMPLNSVGSGVFSPLNSPDARYAAVCWTDNNGNFWRFGGDDYSDLWQYNPVINQWALADGTLTPFEPAVFGVQGVPSPSSIPSNARHGHPAWKDTNGNLWLYGINFSDDLWKFDIATNMWTWVKGSGGATATTIYGTQGVPDLANTPGALDEIDCNWTDTAGNLWLFTHEDGVLWKYSIASNMWTWVKGTIGNGATYGTIGQFGTANEPGFFAGSPMVGTLFTMWNDNSDNLFMIVNRDAGASVTEEIWMYSISLNQWMCKRSDPSAFGANQIYPPSCTETSSGFPIPRTEMRTRWTDECNRLWVFGGTRYSDVSTVYNDLWRYDPVTNNWTWVRDGQTSANFGTYGVPSVNNRPHATAGAQRWTTPAGFWLSGGQDGAGTALHHLWLYRPDTVVAQFTYSATCPSAQFTDQSYSGCNSIRSWQWNFGDPASGSANTDSSQNPVHTFTASGTYNVQLIVRNCTWDADTLTQSITIDCGVQLTFTDTVLCIGNCTEVFAQTSGGQPPYTYQWSGSITDSTAGPFIVCPSSDTSFTAIVTDALGDSDTATLFITILPQASVNLGNDTTSCNQSVDLIAPAGYTWLWSTGSTSQQIQVNTSGNYSVTVSNGGCSATDTIAVQIDHLNVELGPPVSLCESTDTVISTGINNALHLWNTGATGNAITVQNEGIYWVQVILGSCSITDSIDIHVLPYPVTQMPSTVNLCPGAQFQLNGGIPATSWIWNTGATTQDITVTQSGIYSVESSNQQCTRSDSTIVTLVPGIHWNVDQNLCDAIDFILNAGVSGDSYLWSTGDTTQAISITEQGVYSVTVHVNGCVLQDSITIHGSLGGGVLYLPNAFTPDNDGINDRFFAKGDHITTFRLEIFNRWGETVYSSDDLTESWDGTYKSLPAKSDLYTWKVTYKTTCTAALILEKTGHVTLIR